MTIRNVVGLVALAVLLGATGSSLAQPPAQTGTSAPTDAQVRELQRQVQSLQRQLDEIAAAKTSEAQQRLVLENWHGMQNYLGNMHDRWGMGYPWMMGQPWSRCGPGMMGEGRTWSVPPGLTPERYSEQMRDHVKAMQEQMSRIAQSTDPQERQRLMQEHWQSMYRDMQTMRGMGWMWGGSGMMGPGMMGGGVMGPGMMRGDPAPSSQPLPDGQAAGARLVATYCSQCHASPQPTLHSASEWASVTQRMRSHMLGGWRGIKSPTEKEMTAIVDYMQKHARQ